MKPEPAAAVKKSTPFYQYAGEGSPAPCKRYCKEGWLPVNLPVARVPKMGEVEQKNLIGFRSVFQKPFCRRQPGKGCTLYAWSGESVSGKNQGGRI